MSCRTWALRPGDAAVQAAAGEGKLIGTNGDVSRSGAADAASSLAAQQGTTSMPPGPSPFTSED
jgi:hypothetical protein